MRARFEFGQRRWEASLTGGVSLAIPLDFAGPQASAFGIAPAGATHILSHEDNGMQCDTLSISPHGNGTHTESALHVYSDGPTLADLEQSALLACCVIEPALHRLDAGSDSYAGGAPGDSVITADALRRELPATFPPVVAIRTRTAPAAAGDDTGANLSRAWTDTNPPYFTSEAIQVLVRNGVQHLLTELPSVDREDDDGRVLNHRHFFGECDASSRRRATISEMVHIPAAIVGRTGLLHRGTPAFRTDAAPSQPVFYPARPLTEPA